MRSNSFRFLMLLIMVICSYSQIQIQQCLQFQGQCVRCSIITHLYNGICYTNVPGCIAYKNGIECSRCDQSVSRYNNGTCILKQNMTDLSVLSVNQGNLGGQYGDSSFMLISLEQVSNWPTFQNVDRDIRTGQYGFRIKNISDPIISVNYYIKKDSDYSYKILYDGSAGGIFLLISDINPVTNKISIKSFVSIDTTSLIEFCIDYTLQFQCLRCIEGFHLYQGICYINTGNCLQYRLNICVKCADYNLLVQNRCVSDCIPVSDTRSILYYQSANVCTLQTFSGVQIDRFY